MESHDAEIRNRALREAQLVIVSAVQECEAKARATRHVDTDLESLFKVKKTGGHLVRPSFDQLIKHDEAGCLTPESRTALYQKAAQEARRILARQLPRTGDGKRTLPYAEGFEEFMPGGDSLEEEAVAKGSLEAFISLLRDELGLSPQKILIAVRSMVDEDSYDDIKEEVKRVFGEDLTNVNIRKIRSRVAEALRAQGPLVIKRTLGLTDSVTNEEAG